MLFNHIPFYQRPNNIHIAVSGCLNGDAVRYDGGHKHTPIITEYIGQFATLLPLCPEAGAGFGTPRPTMRLIETDNGIEAHRIEDNANLTPQLMDWCNKTVPALAEILQGAILKKRSPSCGIQSTPIFNQDGIEQSTSSGLFAKMLATHAIVLVDEEWLCDELQAKAFLLRCYLLKELRDNNPNCVIAHYQTVFNLPTLTAHCWRNWLCDIQQPLPF